MTDLRERLHDALDEADFSAPDLIRRSMSRLDAPRARAPLRWAAPLGAAAIAAALVVTLLAVSVNRPPAGGAALPTGTAINNLVDYGFTSPDVGWVHVYSGGDVIARTSDGGKTWLRVLKVERLLPDAKMDVIDDRSAVMVGANSSGPVMWITTDEGAHWKSRNVIGAEVQPVDGVSSYFLNREVGWIILSRPNCWGTMACVVIREVEYVYRTSDGGDSWRLVGTANQTERSLDIQFVSATVGLSVGDGSVAATHDGGKTWKVTDFSAPTPACGVVIVPSTCDRAGALEARLRDERNGIALQTEFSPGGGYAVVSRLEFLTDDGGLTWTRGPEMPTEAPVVFAGSNPLLVLDPAKIPLPTAWHVDSTQFPDLMHGWVEITNSAEHAAVGAHHADDLFRLFATTDFEETWHPVGLPKV